MSKPSIPAPTPLPPPAPIEVPPAPPSPSETASALAKSDEAAASDQISSARKGRGVLRIKRSNVGVGGNSGGTGVNT